LVLFVSIVPTTLNIYSHVKLVSCYIEQCDVAILCHVLVPRVIVLYSIESLYLLF